MSEPQMLDYRSPPPPRERMDLFALVSIASAGAMVLSCGVATAVGEGIFAVGLLLGLVALISGLIAVWRTVPLWRVRAVRVRDARRGASQAVIGTLAGLLAVAVAFSMLPSMRRPRESSTRVVCGSNLRQIGQALRQYAIDDVREGRYPPNFETLLANSHLVPDTFFCPLSVDAYSAPPPAEISKHSSYVYFGTGLTDRVPATVVLAMEMEDHHKGEGASVLFADGSVRFLPWPEVARALAESHRALAAERR